jgi:hypothetical protein
VNGRSHVDIDTDIEIGELGLDADAGDACGYSGVVGAGGNRNLLANLELGALAVGSADAWVLEDACVGVGQQCVEACSADSDSEVGGVDVREGVEGEV